MSDPLRAQRDASIGQLRAVINRGGQLLIHPVDAELRIWQRDCAALVNELSGGSKAHWLSRAYSEALLVRNTGGDAVLSAPPEQIVMRVIDVLDRAVQSLSTPDAAVVANTGQPTPRRFDFVHDARLRPVLEQALIESGRAFESGDFDVALRTTCGILEAIVTDALRFAPGDGGAHSGQAGEADASEWTFARRIEAAERGGLIHNGCARLTPAARAYRDSTASDAPLKGCATTITERDARIAMQVLRVVMRDLDPGR